MADSNHGHTNKGGWNAAVFIIFVEVAERFAYYGLASNLITYLTNDLGQSIATAAKNVNTWTGVSSIFPVIGAFVADSFLGRFTTVVISSFIYLLGMVLMALSASVIPLRYRKAAFFTALYIMAVGEGGHKPCVQTFAADQFNEDKPEEKEAKSSFFNWWYLAIVVSASIAVLAVIYIQDRVSWTAGFSVLAGTVAVALILFLIGLKRYRKQRPVGSPFTRVVQVFVAAARKWHVTKTRDECKICYGDGEGGEAILEGQTYGITYEALVPTNQFRFLDKATIIDDIDASNKTRNPWRLCSVNQVEEVKLVLRLIPIWLSLVMFCSTIAQLHTFFVKQGGTMERSIGKHFTIPPAAFQSVVGLTILVVIPIYDRVFVPLARKITNHPSGITMLQRIGIGLFVATLNMGICGLVEAKRVSVAKHHGLIDKPKITVPMSVWSLIPQYVLVGIGDVFVIVGIQELFYDQMPEMMRSMGAAAYISIVGVGSFISNAIISVVQAVSEKHGEKWLGDNLNRANLHYFYYVIAVLNALSFCAYVWIANRFVYKKVNGADDGQEEETSRSVRV